MKAKINPTHCSKYTNVCALVGRYDDNGNYVETVFENIKLEDMHKSIAENIYLDHDITVQVAPQTEVRVFAKNMNDIRTYCETIDDRDTRKCLLESIVICTEPTTRYIWATIDFEEYKKLLALLPIEP